jgi:molecular chaperone DnaK (HSP70)
MEKNMKKFGLDFGTTNSSISIVDVRGEVQVISIDEIAKDPRVVRSMLYFYPRKLVISEKVPPIRRGKPNLFL